MLLELIPSLNQNKFIRFLNKFYYSVFYIIFIAVLTVVSCIFGIEMYAYYTYVFVAGFVPCLFCKDMTPVFAPLGMAYSSVSLKTNNAMEGHSLFGDRMYHLYIIMAFIVISVLPRLIYELVTKREVRRYKPTLLVGYLIMGVTFILGGLTSPYYSKETAVFGLVEFLALSGCYFIMIYIVKWKEMKRDYFFYLMTFYGLVLTAEVVFCLFTIDMGETMRTGWGINNNIAGQLCLCISAPMYLAIRKKISPLYVAAACVMTIAAGLTNSRTGALFAAVIIVTSFVFVMIKGNKWKRIFTPIVCSVFAGTCIALFFIFNDVAKEFFKFSIYNKPSIFSLSGREIAWKFGYQLFLDHKAFGTGWYTLELADGFRDLNFTFSFVPPRYHNTLFQLIACTGTFGLVAYAYHRYQTIMMTFRKPNLEKIFMFLSILGLTLTSLFDCHLFNLGPGLNYCIIFAFIEGVNIKNDIKKKETMKLKQRFF